MYHYYKNSFWYIRKIIQRCLQWKQLVTHLNTETYNLIKIYNLNNYIQQNTLKGGIF